MSDLTVEPSAEGKVRGRAGLGESRDVREQRVSNISNYDLQGNLRRQKFGSICIQVITKVIERDQLRK